MPPNVQIEIKCLHRSIIETWLRKKLRMTHRKETMNLTKAKNNTKSIEICLILINDKPSKVTIGTESNVSFINKEYYTEIDTPELYQDD